MTIGVIGGGAWGTALAQISSQDGTEPVLLWALEAQVVDAVNARHINTLFLPGIDLAPSIRATGDLADLSACNIILAVAPAQHLRKVLSNAPIGNKPIILCAKGIEAGTGMLMSEIARELCPDAPIAVLSGPTFAHEVAQGLPTAVTLACEDAALAETLGDRIARPTFRPYLSGDVTGAEIGGAVKNVLAIACGVVEGARLGQNARAALIARGFAEMRRFGLARGAQIETLTGLSGLGDLVLTCSSTSSRNFSLGRGLGEGQSAAALLGDRRTVAEGAFTAPVLLSAAVAAGVDMPLVEAVCTLLDGAVSVPEVISAALARPIGPE